jgi:hypothetical protein
MNIEQIRLARRTLERLRVKALNNELSGQPYYEVYDSPEQPHCLCAIGAIASRQVLDQIRTYGAEEKQVRNLRGVPFYEGSRQINVLDRLVKETGLSEALLKRIQWAHDDVLDDALPETREGRVQRANSRVYKHVHAALLQVGITEF